MLSASWYGPPDASAPARSAGRSRRTRRLLVTGRRRARGHADRRNTDALDDAHRLADGDRLLDARRVDASASLALFPQQSDAVNSYQFHESLEPATVDDAVHDGCWVLPDAIVVSLAGMVVTVPPDASVAADYFPLGYAGDGCPAGTYEASGQMFARPEDGLAVAKLRTTMRVRIAGSGAVSTSGSLRVEEA